jgi:Tol biopolymer transport system component
MRWIVFAIIAAALAPAAQSANKDDAERLLKAARNTETVDGDLNGAIRQYQAIVAKYAKTDRAVTSMALVREAECRQKIGDAEARRIYDRVVRDYADQKEAVALARAHLGAPPPTGRQTNILVWSGPKVNFRGGVSPDGRYLSYTDWDTGNLVLHEVATDTDRRITDFKQPKGQVDAFVEGSAISRDGKLIAYNWWGNGKAELQLAGLSGSLNARLLYSNPDITYYRPWDWSPDGKWVSVAVQRTDNTQQIAIVSIADGSFRALKSLDWREPSGLFFSPDGKYLGYDHQQNNTGSERDVSVLSLDGSREIRPVAHPANDVMMGWSPDGKWLLFASDRTGSMGLWGMPFADGKPQAAPQLLRSEIAARAEPIGMTHTGVLYYGTRDLDRFRVQLADVDFATGEYLSVPTDVTGNYLESNIAPDWSPDGRQLVYKSFPGPAQGANHGVMVIRSMETGQARELRPKLSTFSTTKWAPDGRSIMTIGKDLKGRWGIHLVDPGTGDTSTVLQDRPEEISWYPVWSRDGKAIYFKRDYQTTKDSAFIRRELATGAETELIRRRVLGQADRISPDGRYLVTHSIDESANARTLLLIPVEGEVRELMRWPSEVPAADLAGGQGVWVEEGPWAPDGRSVLVSKIRGYNRIEKWRVPIDGGAPQKLDNGFKMNQAIAIAPPALRPDGRRIAFTIREPASRHDHEVWALENFLPKTN